jgi:hypothetical protein
MGTGRLIAALFILLMALSINALALALFARLDPSRR